MFAPRQGSAARPPEVSGMNGAPVEMKLECLDRNGDSFSSKLNDRNVSPAGLRGTADKASMSGADSMQPSTRPGSRGGRSYRCAGLAARRAPRGGSSIRSCAVREGSKVRGRWEGETFYTYTEGPRAGKRDVELWVDGVMESSKKFYGKGEEVLVENWDNLNKLENLTRPET